MYSGVSFPQKKQKKEDIMTIKEREAVEEEAQSVIERVRGRWTELTCIEKKNLF